MTHVRPASSKIVRRELSIVTHAQPVLSAAQPLLGARVTHVTVAHLVVSKIARLALLTVTRVTRTSLAQPVLSSAQPLLGARATHVRHASSKIVQQEPSIVTHVRQELSTEQNLAAHASSTTDRASLTATTATTAPTVALTALTVSTAIAIVTAPSKAHARATQTRRPSLKTRSLSVSRA